MNRLKSKMAQAGGSQGYKCYLCGKSCDGSLYFGKKRNDEHFCKECWQNWQKLIFAINCHPAKLTQSQVNTAFNFWLAQEKEKKS